jgi:hypothetical protein
VTVRGPGNGQNGYCLLDSTAGSTSQATGYSVLPSAQNGNGVDNLPEDSNNSDTQYLDNACSGQSCARPSQPVSVEIIINASTSTPEVPWAGGPTIPAPGWGIQTTPITLSGSAPSIITSAGTPVYVAGPMPERINCGGGGSETVSEHMLCNMPASWFSANNLPDQLDFGWTASTGNKNEIHEISTLAAQSYNSTAPVLGIENQDAAGGNQNNSNVYTKGNIGDYIPGGTVNYTLTPSVSSVGASETTCFTACSSPNTPLTVVDTFPEGITPQSANGTNWSCSVSGQTVTCQDTLNTTYSAGTVLNTIAVSGVVESATTTTLTSSLGTEMPTNTTVTYTANVSPVPDGGTVDFTDNASPISGCGAVSIASNGNATCTVSGGYGSTGSHAIIATYSSDTNFGGSASTTLSAAVVGIATTTSVSGTPTGTANGNNPSDATVTYTADISDTASPSTPLSTGAVTFTQDGLPIACTPTLNFGTQPATATCSTDYYSLPVAGGDLNVTATYAGNATDAGSTGSESAQIPTAGALTADSTSTSLSASTASPALTGESITYTATVLDTSNPGTPLQSGGQPQDYVTFTDNGETIPGCSAVAIDTSTQEAFCTTTYGNGSSGAHNINAAFSGSSDPSENTWSIGGADSLPSSHNISEAIGQGGQLTSTAEVSSADALPASDVDQGETNPTTTTVSGVPNPVATGTSVTYTADVIDATPGDSATLLDGGTVTFIDGDTGLPIACSGSNPATVNHSAAPATATCTLTSGYGVAASYPIIAQYSDAATTGAGSSARRLARPMRS